MNELLIKRNLGLLIKCQQRESQFVDYATKMDGVLVHS